MVDVASKLSSACRVHMYAVEVRGVHDHAVPARLANKQPVSFSAGNLEAVVPG